MCLGFEREAFAVDVTAAEAGDGLAVQEGTALKRNGALFVDGVFFDAARNEVVTGLAIIHNRSDVVKCGR